MLRDGAWTQTQKLSPSDSACGDQFGNALAMQAGSALVGAQSMVSGDQKGTAYVIEKSDGVWGEPAKLTQDQAGSLDLFGSATAYDGTTMLVGAPGATVADRASQETVYFYAAPVDDTISTTGSRAAKAAELRRAGTRAEPGVIFSSPRDACPRCDRAARRSETASRIVAARRWPENIACEPHAANADASPCTAPASR